VTTEKGFKLIQGLNFKS